MIRSKIRLKKFLLPAHTKSGTTKKNSKESAIRIINQHHIEGRIIIIAMSCIDADALLEYAPEYLHYPLPKLLFNRILEIGKLESERVD